MATHKSRLQVAEMQFLRSVARHIKLHRKQNIEIKTECGIDSLSDRVSETMVRSFNEEIYMYPCCSKGQ